MKLQLIPLLMTKRVLMCGGKGGVGKTTLSCALAIKAATLGRNTLLVSTDPAHSLADAFGLTIGAKETSVQPNLTVLELDPDTEVEAYLQRVLGQMRQYVGPDKVGELERQLRLTRHSPGAQEAALLERVAQLLDEGLQRFDLIVFDTAPTGHTLRLLSLPEVMAVWTEGLLKHNKRSEHLSSVLSHLTPGRSVDNPLADPSQHAVEGLDSKQQQLLSTLHARQSLFQRTRRCLSDVGQSAFLFVLTPEKLPLLETERAVDSLQHSHIPVAGLLINRVMPAAAADNSFWQARLEQQATYLADIQQRLGKLPQQQIALQAQDIQGLSGLQQLAEQLL